MIVITNAAVIGGMWLRHGQLAAARGPGAVATALGQLSALYGTYAVLIVIMLMSRLAWIERYVGLDRLSSWHRWSGFAATTLLVAHVALTTVGYAQSANISIWAQTVDFLSHYPDVLMAFVATGLIVAVAVSSARAARRRLTVLGEDLGVADAWATALMVLGSDGLDRIERARPGFDAMVVTDDGEVVMTAGFAERRVQLQRSEALEERTLSR